MTYPHIDLDYLNEDFGEAEEAGTDVPAGDYDVEVTRCELTTTKAGKPCLKWELTILGPRYKNRKLWKYHVLPAKHDDPKKRRMQLGFLKSDLTKVGLKAGAGEQFSQLVNRREEVINAMLKITVSYNDKLTFPDIKFLRREYDTSTYEAPPPEDGIPF